MGKIMPTIAIDVNLFWQIINFFILIYVFNKFFRKPLAKIIEERKQKISDDLKSANEKREAAEAYEKEAFSKIDEAKVKAAEIIKTAEKRADDSSQIILAEAKEKKDRMIKDSEAEVIKMKEDAKDALHKEAASLAVDIAEKIIKQKIDPNLGTTLMDEFINEVGDKS